MREFDAIVIGTGFGGAVAACRLVGAGKRICVLERGRRYESQPPDASGGEAPWSDFPDLPGREDALPDPKRWRWGDDQGLWDLRSLGPIVAVQAAGYGGGSLLYANVHLRAPKEVFEGWPFGRDDLDPYYDLAAYMLNAKPITEAPFDTPEKTRQFRSAAESGLGREEGFFYPPLAVNFDGGNEFGRAQCGCNACGECITGCRQRAKNTLDFNYLAIVEDSGLADVRTQAEAVRIFAREGGGYDVTYLDHLCGGERVASAKWVFVCAGAVGSTELLLRSKANLPNLKDGALGSRFFPNADFPAIVYDATLPDATPRQLAPTQGPTITASLYHEQKTQDPSPWFLLQEGGFPIELARHMGVFRAPILMRRNRHDDRRLRRKEIHSVEGQPSSPHGRPPPDGPPPLLRSLADGLYAILRSESEILDQIAPVQLRDALRQLEEQLDAFQDRHLHTLVSSVRRKVLSRGLLRWLRWLAPSAEQMLKDTEAVLREEYGLGETASERVELATKLGSWLARFDDTHGAHSQNAMILLAMGSDSAGGRIRWQKSDLPGSRGTLWVEMDASASQPLLATLQESLMRDVACALGGKLRLNPLWSFAGTSVTVHSQGGCPMSTDPAKGVTDEAGQVHGYPGLFVMDAAAFPTSIGVNPSATIAAVAERNMARLLGDPARDMARAERWWANQAWKDHAKVALEPPRSGRWVPTVNQPLGIEFSERMSGFHYRHPMPGKGDDASYRVAEGQGRNLVQSLSVELTAAIDDVAAFMHSRDRALALRGDVTLSWADEGIDKAHFSASGRLTLFGSDEPEGERRMLYELGFGGPSSDAFELSGYKRIRNDPGSDAWRDTSGLFTTLRNPKSGAASYGAIHVPLDGFLFEQLPSFRVTNTDDPARIAWTLASFGSYFFGHLQRIYAPQLGRAIEGFATLEIR